MQSHPYLYHNSYLYLQPHRYIYLPLILSPFSFNSSSSTVSFPPLSLRFFNLTIRISQLSENYICPLYHYLQLILFNLVINITLPIFHIMNAFSPSHFSLPLYLTIFFSNHVKTLPTGQVTQRQEELFKNILKVKKINGNFL